MSKKLTPKQDKFCQLYIENGGNATKAYMGAYNASNMKERTINSKACVLLKQDNIAARIDELQAMQAERHLDTVDDIAEMLKQDRDAARKKGRYSAAVSATMGLAKLRGHLVDKKQDVTPQRTKDEIDARIVDLLTKAISGGDSEPSGRAGTDRGEGETLPTVPGHGTA